MSEMQAELPILIVDDEANIRRTLRMVLEGEGLETLEAASAADAEKLLATTRASSARTRTSRSGWASARRSSARARSC